MQLGSLLVATATRLVNGLASAAHRFSQRAASLLWGQVSERWESLGVHGLGQRLMGHWRRLGLLRRWVALVEQLLQRLHAAARFLSGSTPALLNGQGTPDPLFPANDTCRGGKEGKDWAVRDNGSSKPFPSRRWFQPPGLPTDPEPEPSPKPQAKKRVPPSVYSPLRGRVVTVNVRYKFHVNGSAPSSVSPNAPPLTTHTTTTTTTTLLDADNAINPPAPAVNDSLPGAGEEGEERRGVARWLLGRGGGSRATHKTRDWGHKVRFLLSVFVDKARFERAGGI